VNSGKEDDSHQVSSEVKVAKNATMTVVKEEVTPDVNVAVEVGTTSNRNRGRKQSATKRKRVSSADDSGAVQRQIDTEIVHDTLPPRKRKAAVTSSQNDEPLQQEKRTRQSVNKRRPLGKKQHPTRMRQSASAVQKQKTDEEQPESAVVSDGRKKTKVKRELPPVSPVKAVDKMYIKAEKPDVSCTFPSQHACRKFIGAHVSIAGMSAACYQLYYCISLAIQHNIRLLKKLTKRSTSTEMRA